MAYTQTVDGAFGAGFAAAPNPATPREFEEAPMAKQSVDLRGKKILVTGATGQVAATLVAGLAADAEIWALGRFSQEAPRQRLEDLGVRTLKGDLAADAWPQLPRDFDYVLHFAVLRSGDFRYDLAANAEGTGRLMAHCQAAKAFLHCSSCAVYNYEGAAPRREDSPLGDNHRAMFPTYSISKIAAESVVRFCASHFELPTTIIRLNVPYGRSGGWPYMHLLMMKEGQPIDLHPDKPNYYNPIHEQDYLEKIPALLAAATPQATTLNFGGSQRLSIEEWCDYLGALTGFKPLYRDNPEAFGSLSVDLQAMHEAIGPTRMDWREGLRDMVATLAPELLQKPGAGGQINGGGAG